MGKFPALPRGSIKRLFYSVNPFPVEARAYHRGSHAAWEAAAERWNTAAKKGSQPCAFSPGSLSWGGALGIPAKMPDQAAFPLGCRHNTFLTEEYQECWASSQTHRMCQGRSKGKYQIFFLTVKDREERILQKSSYRQKGTKTKVLLVFFSIRMLHSMFAKAPASLCINCKSPVAAFRIICTDYLRISEGFLRGAFIPLVPSVQTISQPWHTGEHSGQAVVVGLESGLLTSFQAILLPSHSPLLPCPHPAPPAMPACCLCSTWWMRPENSCR